MLQVLFFLTQLIRHFDKLFQENHNLIRCILHKKFLKLTMLNLDVISVYIHFFMVYNLFLSAFYEVNPFYPSANMACMYFQSLNKKPNPSVTWNLEFYLLEFYFLYFLINPNSTKRSYKKSPAVISSYNFGLFSSMHSGKQFKLMSLTGCMKKGME